MNIISLEQILRIHILAVDATGGSSGLRDLGRLEAAVAVQTQNVFGEELYSGVINKAAGMIRSIISDHPFVDGNKRTAMLVGLSLLEVNDIVFEAKIGEIEDFAVAIAVEHLDVPAVTEWLNERIH